ncbi:MAG TPA: SPOR domain-containing protein [Candidatus Luteimonas excrementigallinarum]|nr:SPOR domain-containing protein [Candidatus Luteimonas excrementigallinarum]
MAARKGRSQARRNNGNNGGLPGWAWMLIGILVAVIAILVAPRFFTSEGEDGFYRPRANPDATPAQASSPGEDDAPARAAEPAPLPAPTSDPEYDFYTLLPGQEVPMTDAELAASAKAEQERQRQAAQREAAQREADAAQPADTAAQTPAAPATPTQAPAQPTAPATTSTAAAAPAADTTARYLLQAGSFSASGDAEALKARIALLGLGARVESAQVQGRTVYRVRMGPYGTASELAEAKGRLENGGLDAMAIRVQ